ncbi:MAG: TonB-dependent receptor, partial [Pseudomonadota bacterium]
MGQDHQIKGGRRRASKRRLLASAGLLGAAAAALPTLAMAQLDEIVVTAQKREQNLQEVGISISAFGEEEARFFGNDIGALAGQAPGVEAYGNGSIIQSFFIRGIGLNEFAGNFNAPVAIHNDEVYVSKNWQAARPNFDINRIEILKGPQGTIFGRNTTGGAANFYYNEPTQEFEGYLRGEADIHERFNVQGAVGGPITDELSGRFSFYSGFGSGGPQFNQFDGEEHGTPDIHQFRGQLKWEGPATTVKVLAQGGVDNSETIAYKGPGIFNAAAPGFCPEAVAGQVSFAPDTCAKFNGLAALNGRPELETEPADVFTINQNNPPRKNDSFYGGYLRIEHDFDGLLLTSISSYDRYNRDQTEDSDSTPIASSDLDYFNELDQFTQEVRLTGTLFEDRSNFVLGGFYQRDDLSQVDSLAIGVDNPFNLPPANAGLPPRLVGILDQEIGSLAAFFNNDFDVTDLLTLSVGLRYTRERTTLDATTNAGLNDVQGDADLPQTLLVPGGIDNVNGDTSV